MESGRGGEGGGCFVAGVGILVGRVVIDVVVGESDVIIDVATSVTGQLMAAVALDPYVIGGSYRC